MRLVHFLLNHGTSYIHPPNWCQVEHNDIVHTQSYTLGESLSIVAICWNIKHVIIVSLAPLRTCSEHDALHRLVVLSCHIFPCNIHENSSATVCGYLCGLHLHLLTRIYLQQIYVVHVYVVEVATHIMVVSICILHVGNCIWFPIANQQ